MSNKLDRRKFIKTTAIAGSTAFFMPNMALGKGGVAPNSKVSIGFIGVGLRGRTHLRNIAAREDVVIPAICDINPEAIQESQEILKKNNKKEAAVYSKDEYAFLELLERDDIDGVVIATPWLWHTRMAVAAMKAGKYTGLEVSAANTLEECWDLVNTHEETGTHLMLLENVCYAREAMAALKMVREGLFGTIVHATCGYKHDLREVKFNDGKQPHGGGVEFGEKAIHEASWRTQHSLKRNADVYPTHGLGPVAEWFDINRGNRFLYLTATATKSAGLKDYIIEHPQGGKNHPNADLNWKLGDIVTTVIKTANDETIILSHDTNLPRPYSWGFTLHGTDGVWCGQYEGRRIYVEGRSPHHQWETAEAYDEYMKKYDHPLWKNFEAEAKGSGHGGIDFFTDRAFVESVKRNGPAPIDAYDAAAWSAVTPLSEQSVAQGSKPIYFPDFTRGRWINNKPIFGLKDTY